MGILKKLCGYLLIGGIALSSNVNAAWNQAACRSQCGSLSIENAQDIIDNCSGWGGTHDTIRSCLGEAESIISKNPKVVIPQTAPINSVPSTTKPIPVLPHNNGSGVPSQSSSAPTPVKGPSFAQRCVQAPGKMYNWIIGTCQNLFKIDPALQEKNRLEALSEITMGIEKFVPDQNERDNLAQEALDVAGSSSHFLEVLGGISPKFNGVNRVYKAIEEIKTDTLIQAW